MNVNINVKDIQRSHRLGPKGNRPRPVIVHFISYRTEAAIVKAVKDDLFSSLVRARKAGRPTQGTKPKINVREHFTKHRAHMMKDLVAMKRQGVLHSVWTTDGDIIARKRQGEQIHRIKSERDFDRFLRECNTSR